MFRLCRVVCAVLLLSITLLAVPGDGRAQSLPIPGIPNSLGSVGGAESAPAEDPPASATGQDQEADVPPTQALIDILRDDAAREALIRELEAASGRVPADPDPGEAGEPSAPETAAQLEPESQTFADRAAQATHAIGVAIAREIENAWLRIQRVPATLHLTTRVFEGGALADALREVLWPAFFIYLSFLILRFVVLPLRRRIGRASEVAHWVRRFVLRITASAMDLVTIPVAVTVGLIATVIAGGIASTESGEISLSSAQELFVNAFVTIEVARALQRFFLSPRTSSLRIVSLPDSAAVSLWYLGWTVTYLLGYGQLLLVPIVSEGVSLFVGRAVAAVLSAVIVFGLILYVIAVRQRVADWLVSPSTESALLSLLRPVSTRWHWPVLVFLAYLFSSVLTRPGNVLIPLLQTTGEALLVVILGSIVLSALSSRAGRRVHVPAALAERLPLLEERINQLTPAILTIVRAFVLVIIVVLLLAILGLEGVGGFLSGAVLEQFSSGLFSVVLIVFLLSIVWLGMTSWVDFRLNPFVGTAPTSREITLLTLMKNAVTVALIIVGIITSLAQLGMNVGPLIASAGVIGLAISFGAQRMVEDIFSGIFIQAENAMNVGDVVDVGGTVGTVEKLTVRSVTLRDLSGVVHVIPFSSASKISNYMRDFAYHVADIGVAYREDVADVRAAMHDAFEQLRNDPDLAPQIIGDLEWFGLNAFGPSELVMRARIKTVPGQQWGVGRAYNAKVKEIFDERGIEIPFPHQTLYFGEDKSGNAPPLHLRMQRDGEPGGGAGEPAAAPERDVEKTGHAEHGPPPREDYQDRVRGPDHPDEDGR